MIHVCKIRKSGNNLRYGDEQMTGGIGSFVPKHISASRIQKAYRLAKEREAEEVRSTGIGIQDDTVEMKNDHSGEYTIAHEHRIRNTVLSEASGELPVGQSVESKIQSLVDNQKLIFSKINFTEEDRATLNGIQLEFEAVVSPLIQSGVHIPNIPEEKQELFAKLVRGDGPIRFQESFPEEIKNHILCTGARLMMCPTGAELIEEIMKGNFPVEFVVGEADCSMIASPLDEVAALVKNVRYDDS